MKKLVLLLSTLLILSTLVSSPVLAARPSLDYRMHAMFSFLYRNMFLVRGTIVVPEVVLPGNSGGGAGGFVGGDADDYGNGRESDLNELKPINKLISGGVLGPEEQGTEVRKSVSR